MNSRERPEKKSEDRNRRDRSDNRDKRERQGHSMTSNDPQMAFDL